jgi:hypothetical protein
MNYCAVRLSSNTLAVPRGKIDLFGIQGVYNRCARTD